MSKTLLEACEPLFQYVCRLSRSARKGATPDPAVVRAEIRQLLGELTSTLRGTRELSVHADKIELPLIYFVDYTIKESSLPWARDWKELAFERDRFAGDQEFFDLLEQELSDPSEQATERLGVYYTCLGLGFQGFFVGQPEYLRRKMTEIHARIRGRVDADQAARICPEAYEHTDTSDLVTPPSRSLAGVAIALLGLVIVLVAVNGAMYAVATQELRTAFHDIAEAGADPALEAE